MGLRGDDGQAGALQDLCLLLQDADGVGALLGGACFQSIGEGLGEMTC